LRIIRYVQRQRQGELRPGAPKPPTTPLLPDLAHTMLQHEADWRRTLQQSPRREVPHTVSGKRLGHVRLTQMNIYLLERIIKTNCRSLIS
jgi:hypothetical protein